jgi:hypothetical protein
MKWSILVEYSTNPPLDRVDVTVNDGSKLEVGACSVQA